jgi:hypothetical protein
MASLSVCLPATYADYIQRHPLTLTTPHDTWPHLCTVWTAPSPLCLSSTYASLAITALPLPLLLPQR